MFGIRILAVNACEDAGDHCYIRGVLELLQAGVWRFHKYQPDGWGVAFATSLIAAKCRRFAMACDIRMGHANKGCACAAL